MAITSMTGFGTATVRAGGEEIAVELRSVNGKFCEVKARLPRELSSLEAELQKQVKERLARGNVDAHVRRVAPAGLEAVPKVNAALVRAYADSLRQAALDAGLTAELSIRDLLALDGVVALEERPPDLESAQNALRQATAKALEQLVEVRAREGRALEQDLRSRLGTVRRLVGELQQQAPQAADQHRERLRTRVAELAGDLQIDPARLEQEVVLFAERSDVAEELTRLSAHLDELERLLGGGQPVGRQLDFLLQEINREVNTTGSKSQSTALARLVVELKAEIERIREQVQNVE